MAVDFKPCSAPRCKGNAHWSASGKRGLCGAHYKRWRKDNLATDAPKCSVDGCARVHDAHGYCASHYARWRRYGDPLAGETAKGDRTRFLHDVAIPYRGDECILWPFCDNGNGYGIAQPQGRRAYAHRYVCEAVHGQAPSKDHFALHSCGNGENGCVTPKHLRWGTQIENGQDMIAHGNSPRGERHGMAKLTGDQVRAIRGLSGQHSHRSIADMFGVSQQTVSGIIAHKSWAWLE